MRAAVRWLLPALLLVLVAAHVLYWYYPRERAAAPAPGRLPARMLAAAGDGGNGGYDACFWIPYPHQNLAALARALGDWEGWVAAASRLAGLPPPRLPGFGPFAVPPASEIAACSDRAGRRALVAAEVYPAIALVAKAAGRLAGNPWLAGGDVPDRQPPARVAWQGNEWTVSLGGAEPPPPASVPTPPAPPAPADALALLRLARPIQGSFTDLPAGTYRLGRLSHGEGGLELALAGAAPSLPAPAVPPADRPVLLAVAGATAQGPPSALALYPLSSSAPPRVGNLELPGAATFQPVGVPGKGRWSLPGGGIVGFLARSFPQGNAAGWSIVAFDAASLERAKALAPALADLLRPGSGLHLGLWVDPAPARDLVTSIRKLLEKIPLVSRRQVDRWRDGETLLAPLARCRELSLASTGPPDAFALRLAGCG